MCYPLHDSGEKGSVHMYGWRAKIGLITPMSENAEHAFHIYAPEGVSFASMKINFPGPTPEGLIFLTDQLEATAATYKDSGMDLVVFGCTSAAASRELVGIRSASTKSNALPVSPG